MLFNMNTGIVGPYRFYDNDDYTSILKMMEEDHVVTNTFGYNHGLNSQSLLYKYIEIKTRVITCYHA